jgi:hypothetical protein
MRSRFLGLALLVLFTTGISAKDVYLAVGGSIGNFRTDARIFNPSFDKDITVVARYLPSGNGDNSAVATKIITVGKRSMAVYDDVVQSLFGGGAPLGAVRLTSDDDFAATQRIYAAETAGTLGQFVPGLDVSLALRKGAVLQLKQNGARGTKGTFRTNWGGVNPNSTVANIKFTLYDKNNTVAGTNDLTMQPFGVFSPILMSGFFGNPDRDLSDSWFSFESDVPVFLYGSILDNGTEDPTFSAAVADSGVAPVVPQVKIVTIAARNWEFTVNASAPLQAGDSVIFRISSDQETHGFQLVGPNGQILIPQFSYGEGSVNERTVTLPSSGLYQFFCTHISCGAGHSTMSGVIQVP